MFDSTSFYMYFLWCMDLWHFITWIDLCSRHHNQDAQLFHHHKETLSCSLQSHPLPLPAPGTHHYNLSSTLLAMSTAHFFVLLNGILLYRFKATCLIIHLLKDKDIWPTSSFGVLQIKLLWTLGIGFCVNIMFSFPWNKYPAVQLLGCMVNIYLTLQETVRLFSRIAVPIFSFARNVRVIHILCVHVSTWNCLFFIWTNIIVVLWYLVMILVYIWLMDNMLNKYSCACLSPVSPSRCEMFVQVFVHF